MKKMLIILLIAASLTAIVIIGIVGHNHPIFLKYLIGEASSLGKPIPAKVYTDGHLNNGITVYNDSKYKNDYLLSLKEFDTDGMLHYINIDLDNKWVGRPVSSDYDTINGKLYQSEVGSHFIDFKNDVKGFDFDPKLNFDNRTIRLNVPPHWLKFDSIRIELEHY
ncbi:MAG TPA: hypothetical protein VFE54_08805 [Mucilaginibacter sp.]|jgi:hypothetical protein|nr:hypothetical protein [Mucilaginibacter sp.]